MNWGYLLNFVILIVYNLTNNKKYVIKCIKFKANYLKPNYKAKFSKKIPLYR